LVCEGILNDARQALQSEVDPLNRAYWCFLASWMGRNGTAGTKRVDYQLAVRWTNNGGSPTVRWRNAVESLPAWHVRLQNVVILQRDAFAILDRFEDSPKTAIYLDPPYLADTRSGYRKGKGPDHKYLHEFSHDDQLFGDDHVRLRDIVSGYKRARIVISYYDSPRVRDLYQGWTFVEKTRQKNLHVQNGRGSQLKEAPEVLIINGPSYAER
jgi:DNA adenine methylase